MDGSISLSRLPSSVATAADSADWVCDVNASKLAWSLVVGIVRLYEMQNKHNPSEVVSLEMILQDERGDRIHCSVPKNSVDIYKSLLKENGIYSMKNFIVQPYGKSLRTTEHKFKLSVYLKTCVSRLATDAILYTPFRFQTYATIESMAARNEIYLIDAIGYVVGKEDVSHLVTKTGKDSTLLAIYIEDTEKNRMKVTLFGSMVSEALAFLEKEDAEPLVMVAQLFKPHMYLTDIKIQNSFYTSRMYFNPDFPEVVAFRERLMQSIDVGSQMISHVQSQRQISVSEEISGGSVPIKTIEEVLNMTEESTCWILGVIVSIEVGLKDWFYNSCVTCPRKVPVNNERYWCNHCRKGGLNPQLRYRLSVIVADGTGCAKLILWNNEARLIVGRNADALKEESKEEHGVSYPTALDGIIEKKCLFKLGITEKNINAVDQVYSVLKICDNEEIILEQSSKSSSYDNPGMSDGLGSIVVLGATQESENEVNYASFVSLSKESGVESNGETGQETPVKSAGPDSKRTVEMLEICDIDVHGSCNKTFKRVGGKRKKE